MYIGVNTGSTSSKKILRDGSSAFVNDELEIRSIAEERVTGIKAKGGYIKSLVTLFSEEEIQSVEINSYTISTCCEPIRSLMETQIEINGLKVKTDFVSHHYSHALCSFAFSGFDKAIVAVWDCGGNFEDSENDCNQNWWEYKREQHSYYLLDGNKITPLFDEFEFDNPFEMGFGEVYRSLTYLLGFESYIHSSKAMALAAYGNCDKFRDKEFYHFDESSGKITSPLKYQYESNFNELVKWAQMNLGIQIEQHCGNGDRNQTLLDFAAFIQIEMERVAIKKINFLIKKYNIAKVCIGGGVGLNCVMNYKIRENSEVVDIYVPPACGDVGQSMGNAIFGYFQKWKRIPDLSTKSIYLGTEVNIINEILSQFNDYYVIKLNRKQKPKVAAYLLFTDNIIGWCQGRSEWGPRALGNRSILCKASNLALAEKLRTEIKYRNNFEPFAASVLEEDIHKYFATATRKLPFMIEVVKPKKEAINSLKNCLHVDGTCRVQTVNNNQNITFYELLSEYKKLSEQSVILNTSLNQRGNPICETAEDAFYFFVSSNLEIIFIGDFVIVKNQTTYNDLLAFREKLNHEKGIELIEKAN